MKNGKLDRNNGKQWPSLCVFGTIFVGSMITVNLWCWNHTHGFCVSKSSCEPHANSHRMGACPIFMPKLEWLIVLYVLRPKHYLYSFIYFAIKGDGHPPIDRDSIYIYYCIICKILVMIKTARIFNCKTPIQ